MFVFFLFCFVFLCLGFSFGFWLLIVDSWGLMFEMGRKGGSCEVLGGRCSWAIGRGRQSA